MFQFTAFEKNAFAVLRRHRLQMIGVVNKQFAAVRCLPIGIQIHDHRVCPALVILELIQVFFIKTAGFVQCVMEFITSDPRITGTIQIADKTIQEFEETMLLGIIMLRIQPIDFIAPDPFIVDGIGIVSNARGQQLFAGIQGL